MENVKKELTKKGILLFLRNLALKNEFLNNKKRNAKSL